MARSSDFDPLMKFAFRVYVLTPQGATWVRGGFTSCSAPGLTISYQSYPEGGRHLNPLKIHDSVAYKPITVARGVIDRKNVDDFGKWVNDFFEAVNNPLGLNGVDYRNNIVIEHLNRAGSVVKRYYLQNCVPTAYTPADDFTSTDSEVSVESLTFEYEGFEEERVDDNLSELTSRIKSPF
jgi:phage tail-like protein